MSENTNQPYYNNRFSTVKRILNVLVTYCDTQININKYNLKKIVSYKCKGYDLIGSSCDTRDARRHFIVKNNNYEVYEIPMRSNKGLKMTGKYLVLLKNLDFKYWTIAYMEHEFDKDKCGIVNEKVHYHCICEFDAQRNTVTDNYSVRIINAIGNNCCRGFRSKSKFDSDNIRKESGYHTTTNVINKVFNSKLL